MLHLFKRINKKKIILLINFIVFVFFISVLSFKKGYSYVPMLLAIVGLIYIPFHYFKLKQKFEFNRDDKLLIFSFIAYFCSFLISVLVHSDGFREIDNPSRVLLFLPLILFFSYFPINIKTLLYGIPTGSAVVGLLAVYHKFILGLELPFPEIMRIQAGNISMTLAIMSLTIAIYWGVKKDYKIMWVTSLCSCLGILGSALSGARGGWVGLPIVIGIILFFAYKNLSKKLTIGVLIAVVLSVTAVVVAPQTNVAKRIDIAYIEVKNFFEKNHRTTSLGARFDMWNSAILGIKEKPILGWGSKGYHELKEEQYNKKIIAKNTLRFNDAHNQYLDSWVKRGVLGLMAVLFVLFIPFFLFYKHIKNDVLEVKLLCMLGIIYVVSTTFYFFSQTFLAHNSGSIFYFFLVVVIYSSLRTLTYTGKR